MAQTRPTPHPPVRHGRSRPDSDEKELVCSSACLIEGQKERSCNEEYSVSFPPQSRGKSGIPTEYQKGPISGQERNPLAQCHTVPRTCRQGCSRARLTGSTQLGHARGTAGHRHGLVRGARLGLLLHWMRSQDCRAIINQEGWRGKGPHTWSPTPSQSRWDRPGAEA